MYDIVKQMTFILVYVGIRVKCQVEIFKLKTG